MRNDKGFAMICSTNNGKQFHWRSMLMALSFIIFHLAFSVACSETHEHTAAAILPEDSVSMMTSYGVNTLISDSGVIKYRIVAERWEVNTLRQPTRWEFMKGVFFEEFDEKFRLQAYVQADTAWYYDQLNLWKLRGRVQVRNIDGLIFTSEELYWDGRMHELYSNVYSRLVTPERTMEGTCFRSNEDMTRYNISNSQGSFVNEDIDGEKKETEPAATTDTATVEMAPVRPASQKHRHVNK